MEISTCEGILKGEIKLDDIIARNIVSTLSKFEGDDSTVENLEVVGLVACKVFEEYPLMALELLPPFALLLQKITLPISIGKILSQFTCSIPIIFRSYQIENNNLLLLVAEFSNFRKTFLEVVIGSCEHAGVLMRAARLLQLLALCMAPQRKESEIDEVEDELDNLLFPPEMSLVLREEGNKCLEKLVSLLWKENVPAGVLLAVLNLLGRVARLRTVFLPKLIPALVAVYEKPPSHLTDHQLTCVCHTLERQLAALMESQAAERYYSLIMEVLKRCHQLNGKKRKQDEHPTVVGEEDEEAQALAAVGTKRVKTSGAGFDATAVDLLTAAQVVLVLLQQVPLESFKVSLEKWRPENIMGTVRDPRRQQMVEEASGALQETAVDDDKMAPFELLPRAIHSKEDMETLLKEQFRFTALSVIESSRDLKHQKSSLKMLIKMTVAVQSPVQDELLDLCFENLNERLTFLLYYLRLLWRDQQTENIEIGDHRYDAAYEAILLKLQDEINGNKPGWEGHLQKILLDAPVLSGDLHLRLLEWLCGQGTTRLSALAIMEQTMLKRPALRHSILEMFLTFCMVEEEGFRRATISIVCDTILNLTDCRQYVFDSATRALTAMELGENENWGKYLDFPIKLAMKLPAFLPNIFSTYSDDILLEAGKSYITNHLHNAGDLNSASGTEIVKQLVQLPYSPLLHVFLELLGKTKDFDPLLLDPVFEMIRSGQWPPSLCDTLIPFANQVQLLSILEKYLLACVDLEDAARVGLILNRLSDRLTPESLLVALHQPSALPLKNSVALIQTCLTLFKPAAIADALRILVDIPDLPPMLFRTLIQSFTLHRSLTSFCVGMLARLMGRMLGAEPRVWDGFVRCVKALGPAAHAVLLQMPRDLLDKLMEAAPELHAGFMAYVGQQSSAIKARYDQVIDDGTKEHK